MFHLLGSLLVVTIAATLVFGLWYPFPYRYISGGLELFWLVVGVDVICGPLLTLVLFSPKKPRAELVRDLGMVGLIQLSALTYGLWTVVAARPVFLTFEADRFRVVTAADIDPVVLPDALDEFRALGYKGPKVIAARTPRPKDPDYMQGIQLSLQGFGPALRPSTWRSYASFADAVLAKARPLALLKARYPESLAEIDAAINDTGLLEKEIAYLPVQGRHDVFWVALVALNDARVLGFIPLDGY